ncbi:MAG: aminotransferase class I/II-fold pyridoxal phosphate-dependent enzyme, partial [Bifidobacteriaceae bacterium]|nr:aminotransferase class I/II-fold pyridoxal phosphate-dependent enzyme [Bifidobacteriaceae bacterium]
MSPSPTTPTSHNAYHFDTAAVHEGQAPDPVSGAIVPPITLATTFRMADVETPPAGYDYSRGGNPTRAAYERALAALEGGGHALAYPSGMAAIDAVIRVLVGPGQAICAGRDVYGGVGRLLTWIAPAEGRRVSRVATTDLAGVAAALERERPRVLWVETPSNPGLEVTDLRAVADLAHAAGALLVVDNTFATPVLQTPIALGADAVVHSTTKFVGGHSDMLGGAVIVRAGLELPEPGLSG